MNYNQFKSKGLKTPVSLARGRLRVPIRRQPGSELVYRNQPQRNGRQGNNDNGHSVRNELRILYALRQIIRRADVDSRRLSADHEITGPQLLALTTVANDSDITAKDISERIHVSPSTVVGVLDRLEQRGLIQRERSEQDRRRVLVNATSQGRKLVRRVRYPMLESIQDVLEEMPQRRRDDLASALEKLVAKLQEKAPEA